jgi:hypothetical protein
VPGFPRLLPVAGASAKWTSGFVSERAEFFNTLLGNLGYEPAGGTPQALANLIAVQTAYWSKVIKDAGITMPQ